VVEVRKACPLTLLLLLLARRKTQVKAIHDESEGLKPEALEQMKRELKLLQGKVVANIEKELKAASDKGEEEREAVLKEANELIACIDADSKRLHGADVETVGRAEKLVTDFWFAHLVKSRRWAEAQAMAVDEEEPADAGERARPRCVQSNAAI
jgi:hypothetical protein